MGYSIAVPAQQTNKECHALVTCRIALGREDVLLAAKDDPSQLADAIAALDCRGNFMFDPATHRDFLGAILGTGVVRDKVGVSMQWYLGY